ncbi:hypothetical protein RHS01_08866 [Rhizoctonia solani]|uniref:Uncharacterized protein n=1 Tax=Rhizoctonia solani TaxID=456999 RepID=A0A8H7I8G9_9AGAM|nr:hypothetical protein RHS01_08866 [Rhizoctonia solani]
MSHPHNSSHDSTYYGSGSGLSTSGPDGDLPPFKLFLQPGTAGVAHGSSQRYRTADDANTRRSGHPSLTDDPAYRERQRTSTLPEFTPFPSASPGHRYAPPEGARAPQPRPIPPQPYAAETGSSYLPVPPANAIRVPLQVLKL